MQVLFEYLVKIAGIVKAYAEGQSGHGAWGRNIHLQNAGGTEDTVFHQIFKRSELERALKTAAAFTFAQMNGCCKIIQCDIFTVMFLDIKDGFFHSGFIQGNSCFF